jgi:outer membrane cobalamin receptor
VALRTAPLVVVQRNSSSFDQRMAEFRRRRRAGGGVFLERAEIERRNPRTLTDLLRTVPGVRVLPQGTGFRYVSSHFRRVGEGTGQGTGSSHDGACDMMLYIDGLPFPSDGGEVDSRVRVEDIAAAEVYVSAGSVPRQFAGTSAACGVIVVWRGR